ncbi:MAG: P44/Msp2 family outer membrane protein [Anaplasma sp.]
MNFLRYLAVSFIGLSLVHSSSADAGVLDSVVDSLRGLYVDAIYRPASPLFSDLKVRGPFGTAVHALPLSEVKSGVRVLYDEGRFKKKSNGDSNGCAGGTAESGSNGSDSRCKYPQPPACITECRQMAVSGPPTCLCLAGVGSVRGLDFERHGSRVLASANDYRCNLSGFGLALGYPVGNVRVELEMSGQRFDVERGSHELTRYRKEEEAEHGYSVVHMKLAGDPGKPLAHVGGGGSTATDPAAAPPEDEAAVVVKDDGIRLCSVVASLCRDFKLSTGDNISPYACAGFGFERLGMFGTSTRRVAYQAKAGVTYKLRGGMDGFAGVFYRRLRGSKEVVLPWSNFEVISTVIPAKAGDTSDSIMPVDLLLDLNVAYFGAEVGIRFSL